MASIEKFDPSFDERITKFLFGLASQEKPGLIVVRDESGLASVRSALDRSEVREACTWWSLLTYLQSQEDTFMVVTSDLSLSVYDILDQFTSARSKLTVVDDQTYELATTQIDAEPSHLLLVTTSKDLGKIEEVFPITEKVGPVELI